MKLIPIILITMFFALSYAGVGEVSGQLNYSLTAGQSQSLTWTLVNTGNTSASFNLILPKSDPNFILEANVSNGTISPNSRFPINVRVELLNATEFSGILTASFQSTGNIQIQVSKKININIVNQAPTPSNSPNTTKVSATTIPATLITAMQSTTIATTTMTGGPTPLQPYGPSQNKTSSTGSIQNGSSSQGILIGSGSTAFVITIPYLIGAVVIALIVIFALWYYITKKYSIVKKGGSRSKK